MPENETKERPEPKRKAAICGLCLSVTVSGPKDDLPWTLSDPNIEIEYVPMCAECAADIMRHPPNLARFGARLWNDLRDRIVDVFGSEDLSCILTLWQGYMVAVMSIWSHYAGQNAQQASMATMLQMLNPPSGGKGSEGRGSLHRG